MSDEHKFDPSLLDGPLITALTTGLVQSIAMDTSMSYATARIQPATA